MNYTTIYQNLYASMQDPRISHEDLRRIVIHITESFSEYFLLLKGEKVVRTNPNGCALGFPIIEKNKTLAQP